MAYHELVAESDQRIRFASEYATRRDRLDQSRSETVERSLSLGAYRNRRQPGHRPLLERNGMSNLVIVAIPAADEIVWKVSSEKVPHLTLLFLGELEPDDNVQRMADFIEHAVEVSEHGPFYLEVDYRDTLGPDDADVLFFKDNSSAKWINSFRGQLLQQNDIRAEYEEAEAAGLQYPEWNPHLTLGYPSAPAKEIPDNRSIYSVAFDRIALWTTDFDGPTFRLEWPERDSS